MSKIALIFFIAFELSYYLLIAQTGIVEYFSSNILLIAPLPIGGIIGSVLSYYIKTSNEVKIKAFLGIQLGVSVFYPNLSMAMLFILGISVGALAPLLINELKKASNTQIALALAISYTMGTFLFDYDVAQRQNLAVLLTVMTLGSSFFIASKDIQNQVLNSQYPLWLMSFWVFLDSALFETVSRDLDISIWRDGYTYEIAIFHIIGVLAGFLLRPEKNQQALLILGLFTLSYMAYFLKTGLILAIVYPFVISYYNVTILKSISQRSLKTLAFYMICIGWIASGAGLFIAVNKLILFVPVLFLGLLIKILITQQIQQKEKLCLD